MDPESLIKLLIYLQSTKGIDIKTNSEIGFLIECDLHVDPAFVGKLKIGSIIVVFILSNFTKLIFRVFQIFWKYFHRYPTTTRYRLHNFRRTCKGLRKIWALKMKMRS